ncbi:hypothetical protein [Marinigracilibium pacificum]|uniref:Nuclear transport factor 2 family protein n=1 Tax=Marinigracilibium pacificum TaxID=2729599 RepID=A0A848IYE1_9BACT|nr:hypothetical protein [Marinigracilibium pacificum]NMM47310.1 hypothetical protein [Marinigracilibium pacificum]
MKTVPYFIILLILYCSSATGQNTDFNQNVSSVDSIIETLYSVISGEKGEKRNWEKFKYLFHPEARLIPTIKNDKGLGVNYLTPQDYINRFGQKLEENGFYEKEIHRVTERFGNIVHLFSTYESYQSKTDNTPFARGINSIQLLYDGTRWWIINIYWQSESSKHPLPDKYLPKNK